MSKWPDKDPDAVLDYAIDWSDRLGGDGITSSAWIVPDGIIKERDSFNGSVTTIWLSGGTNMRSYPITNRITTAGGRTMDKTVRIEVREQ